MSFLHRLSILSQQINFYYRYARFCHIEICQISVSYSNAKSGISKNYYNLTGPAFFTSSEVSFSNNLKFSINLEASASYFFQYSFLFPHEFDGSSTSSGTSGQLIGTSNPNSLSFLYLTLSSLPSNAAFNKFLVWRILIRFPTPNLPPTQPVFTSQTFALCFNILCFSISAYSYGCLTMNGAPKQALKVIC